jgi:hypothetical protein
MCTHIWRFLLEWRNVHKYGYNNQRGTFEVGLAGREKGDEFN